MILACVFSLQAVAGETVKIDRYTSIRLGASDTQRDPLKSVVQLQFPSVILNTEQAINYALDDSGYSVIEEALWSPEMKIMMANSLSIVHRDMTDTPMSLREILVVLAGTNFRLVQDPLRRKVSFVLLDEYRGLIGEQSHE